MLKNSNHVIKKMLGKLIVRCDNFTQEVNADDDAAVADDAQLSGEGTSSASCTWQGEWSNLATHLSKDCGFVMIGCKQCTENMPRKDLAAHQLNCPLRVVVCLWCNCNMRFRDNEKHKAECTHAPVVCTAGCSQTLLKKDLQHHIERECAESVVPCCFAKFGCPTKVPRKLMEEHETRNNTQHLRMMTEMLQHQSTAMAEIKSANDMLHKTIKSKSKHMQQLDKTLSSTTQQLQVTLQQLQITQNLLQSTQQMVKKLAEATFVFNVRDFEA
jgi:hypothetical protein